MIISMKLCGKKAEIMHMVVIWEFGENHVIRRITRLSQNSAKEGSSREESRAREMCPGMFSQGR